MVAYYFPPMGLSGVQRVAKFVKYLPEFGWEPEVLTVEPGGYFAYDESLLEEVKKAGVRTHRTKSWDPTRLFGKKRTVQLPAEGSRRWLTALSQFVFIPDNKMGWRFHAVRAGARRHKEAPFDLIFSTAPPYTAHLIGASLSRKCGIPLITDFRDDWVGNPRHLYPTPVHRWLHLRLERRVLRASAGTLAINKPISDALEKRHAQSSLSSTFTVLPQGFDPADFDNTQPPADPVKMRLVYTGVFYDAQTPDYFLRALANLIARRPETGDQLEALFVGLIPATSQKLVASLDLEKVVRYEGYLPHNEAVAHLLAADVLWMTIGRRPGAEGISTGKLFEYMGAGKPILALTPEGTARETLNPYGAATIVEPDDTEAISQAIEALWEQWKKGTLPRPDAAYIAQFNRKNLTKKLAQVFEEALPEG